MRKHVILLVHGMGAFVTAAGTPDETWFNDSVAALKEQYLKYSVSKRKSFEDSFDIVHINYDTEIFKLVSRWQTESQAVLAAGVPAAVPAQKLVSWLKSAAKLDGNFAWSHAACVILYRFFPLMRQRIKIRVAAQFQAALATNQDGPVAAWSVIAHSLGTIVTHDVLQALDSTTPNEAGISLLDAMVPSANLVAMIANVSKILQTDSVVYDSLVVPQSLVQNQAACYSYLSCRNEFDPFVLLDPFAPVDLPAWKLAESNGTYVDAFTHNVYAADTHSFRNYIVNPDVHIPLLQMLVGPGSITAQEAADARHGFVDIPESVIKQEWDTIMTKVGPPPTGQVNTDGWFDLLGRFYAQLLPQQTAQGLPPLGSPSNGAAAPSPAAFGASTGISNE